MLVSTMAILTAGLKVLERAVRTLASLAVLEMEPSGPLKTLLKRVILLMLGVARKLFLPNGQCKLILPLLIFASIIHLKSSPPLVLLP